jgi:hypothetical protein
MNKLVIILGSVALFILSVQNNELFGTILFSSMSVIFTGLFISDYVTLKKLKQ